MAKNRNKRKNAMAMDVSSGANSVVDTAQVSAMDTSETVDPKITFAANLRKTNKGRPMKRSKSLSKRKAIAKAISLTEKSEAKLSKNESKSQRTKQAKNLYD